MKTLYRSSIFETNSSAVHSLVVMSRNNYEEWKKNEVYVKSGYLNKLYILEEALADANEFGDFNDDLKSGNMDAVNERLIGYGYYRHDDYLNSEYDDTDFYEYTTEHGYEIVICSRYDWS